MGMTNVAATLDWESPVGRHRERLCLPESALQASGALVAALGQLRMSGRAEVSPEPWVRPAGEAPVTLPGTSFRLRVRPAAGRFYPRLAFAGLAEGARDLRPCRLLSLAEQQLVVDPNHPLAGLPARLSLIPCEGEVVLAGFQQLFDGPGMQVPPADPEAAYLPAGSLSRQDEASDAHFYAQPRLVHHLDAVCRGAIAALYQRFLTPGQRVLDLMSSWTSHLPDAGPEIEITGLGMNREELEANPRLRLRLLHDLNEVPALPVGNDGFDLALCTASVEYLTHPHAVFQDLVRVLRPGGRFVVSFSDRWFPTKVIGAWSELHPFERMGLVVSLFRSAGFTDLHTETLRGLRRPADDKYTDLRDHSDPLFAVWGSKPL